MEDFFRIYFYLLLIPVGWVLFNEVFEIVFNKMFGKTILKKEKKRLKKRVAENEIRTYESKVNFDAVGISVPNDELKRYLDYKTELHNDNLKYMEWTGFYIDNETSRLKLENGCEKSVLRHLKTPEEKINAKKIFNKSAENVFYKSYIHNDLGEIWPGEIEMFEKRRIENEEEINKIKTHLSNIMK